MVLHRRTDYRKCPTGVIPVGIISTTGTRNNDGRSKLCARRPASDQNANNFAFARTGGGLFSRSSFVPIPLIVTALHQSPISVSAPTRRHASDSRVGLGIMFGAAFVLLTCCFLREAASLRHYGDINPTVGAWAANAFDAEHGILYRPLISDSGYGGTRYAPLRTLFQAAILKWTPLGTIGSAMIVSAVSTLFMLAGCYALIRRFGLSRAMAALMTCLTLSAACANRNLRRYVRTPRLRLQPLGTRRRNPHRTRATPPFVDPDCGRLLRPGNGDEAHQPFRNQRLDSLAPLPTTIPRRRPIGILLRSFRSSAGLSVSIPQPRTHVRSYLRLRRRRRRRRLASPGPDYLLRRAVPLRPRRGWICRARRHDNRRRPPVQIAACPASAHDDSRHARHLRLPRHRHQSPHRSSTRLGPMRRRRASSPVVRALGRRHRRRGALARRGCFLPDRSLQNRS